MAGRAGAMARLTAVAPRALAVAARSTSTTTTTAAAAEMVKFPGAHQSAYTEQLRFVAGESVFPTYRVMDRNGAVIRAEDMPDVWAGRVPVRPGQACGQAPTADAGQGDQG